MIEQPFGFEIDQALRYPPGELTIPFVQPRFMPEQSSKSVGLGLFKRLCELDLPADQLYRVDRDPRLEGRATLRFRDDDVAQELCDSREDLRRFGFILHRSAFQEPKEINFGLGR